MKSHITAAVVPRFNLLKNHFLFIIVSPFSTTKSPRQGRWWFVPAETNLRASPPARRDSCSVTSQPREKDDLLFNLDWR
ncbi:hypothetical protein P8452_55779 [Trifolium repens]|nr:hypothetical protein P8452_55779 [Trifolium repens]